MDELLLTGMTLEDARIVLKEKGLPNTKLWLLVLHAQQV